MFIISETLRDAASFVAISRRYSALKMVNKVSIIYKYYYS